jgi:hypothetical protein
MFNLIQGNVVYFDEQYRKVPIIGRMYNLDFGLKIIFFNTFFVSKICETFSTCYLNDKNV